MTSPSDSPYRGAQVMVLGAGGFIGRWIARELCRQGARVHVVGRSIERLEHVRRTWRFDGDIAIADLARPAAVRELFLQVRPAVVFNLAAYGVNPSERDPALAHSLNADLPGLLAEAMSACGDAVWTGQHVVHAGSALEYGTAAGDLRETTACKPTTVYGRAKLDGTIRLHESASRLGVRAVTARAFTVYGRGEHESRLLPSLRAAALTATPIPLTAGLQRRDFTYVADLVEGMLRLGALPHAAAGPVNVATSQLVTVRAFVEAAAAALGIASERLQFGAMPTRQEEMHHDPVTVDRLRALTGWAPATSIVRGLELATDRNGVGA